MLVLVIDRDNTLRFIDGAPEVQETVRSGRFHRNMADWVSNSTIAIEWFSCIRLDRHCSPTERLSGGSSLWRHWGHENRGRLHHHLVHPSRILSCTRDASLPLTSHPTENGSDTLSKMANDQQANVPQSLFWLRELSISDLWTLHCLLCPICIISRPRGHSSGLGRAMWMFILLFDHCLVLLLSPYSPLTKRQPPVDVCLCVPGDWMQGLVVEAE